MNLVELTRSTRDEETAETSLQEQGLRKAFHECPYCNGTRITRDGNAKYRYYSSNREWGVRLVVKRMATLHMVHVPVLPKRTLIQGKHSYLAHAMQSVRKVSLSYKPSSLLKKQTGLVAKSGEIGVLTEITAKPRYKNPCSPITWQLPGGERKDTSYITANSFPPWHLSDTFRAASGTASEWKQQVFFLSLDANEQIINIYYVIPRFIWDTKSSSMDSQPDTADIIVRVCSCLSQDDTEGAKQIIRSECPIGPKPIVRDLKLVKPEHDHPKEEWDKGQPTPDVATKVFLRDGFIDRYTDNRLVFPGTLLLLSRLIPEVFPYDSAWRSWKGHQMYWDLFATVDHIYPKSRGGGGGTNFLTTSMNMNKSKGDHTPEEVGLSILPRGNRDGWDGLIQWFISYMDSHPDLKKIPKEEPGQSVKIKALMKWYRAATR